MLPLTFEWDPRKDRRNQRKHGVSFSEAASVFFDEEDRYLLLGMSAKLRMLVVSHVYRDDDRMIRIISAWLATPQERDQYAKAV